MSAKPWLCIAKIIRIVEVDRIRKNGNGAFRFGMERTFLSGQCGPTMMSYFAISRKA